MIIVVYFSPIGWMCRKDSTHTLLMLTSHLLCLWFRPRERVSMACIGKSGGFPFFFCIPFDGSSTSP
ncbi:unnamed protein product [Linum trigynum]|uniref:Uncharacterized protein n=1 Tax=Linum trigynum TaxID=586398 RepID=A0AAV2DR72_9ROSI